MKNYDINNSLIKFHTINLDWKIFLLASCISFLISCASDIHAPEIDDDFYADEHEWIDEEKDKVEQDGFSIYQKDKLNYERHDELIKSTKDEFNDIIDRLPEDEDAYKQALLDTKSVTTSGNETITIYPCYFEESLSDLGTCDRKKLDKLAQQLSGATVNNISVIGHTNNVPLTNRAAASYGNNQGLSEKRAKEVAKYLSAQLNIPMSQISYSGAGDSQPIASNDTNDGRKRNRRVEINLDYTRSTSGQSINMAFGGVPEDYTGWWEPVVLNQMDSGSSPKFEDLNSLYLRAIENSSQIKVFSDIPLIRETGILEAEGEFDPHVFFQTRYGKKDEPVGSTLRTGGADRFREDEWRFRAGARKKVWSGGEIEASQRVGGLDTNSSFFQPEDQALTEFAVSFTQPLWNGAGAEYTRSTVKLAHIDHSVSEDEFQRQVESHLLEVARSYWSLYYERANLAIKKRLVSEAGELVSELDSRRSIDVIESQLARSRAALNERKAEVSRNTQAVRNSEAKLVSLLNDPEFRLDQAFEIVPKNAPSIAHREITVREAARHAVQNRPEIQQAMKQIEAGMVRTKMAENEMLPVLDFVMEASWNGLEEDYGINDALGDQFQGTNYFVGLNFDIPIGNREAKARYQRRRIEVRQLTNQMRTTIDTLLLEVQVAVRELSTAKRELGAKYLSMEATRQQLASMQNRRGISYASGEAGSSYIERLLSAQERLADEESSFIQSQLTYNVALTNLDRAMGILMDSQKISPDRIQPEDDLPYISLDKI